MGMAFPVWGKTIVRRNATFYYFGYQVTEFIAKYNAIVEIMGRK